MYENSDYAHFVEEGNEYCFMHDYSKAIFSYSQAIALNPPSPVLAVVHSNRAYCYTKLEMLQEAHKDVSISLEIDPLNQVTNTVSDIYESNYLRKTVLPIKSQRNYQSLPHYATVNYLTSCSEKIDESDENKKLFYTYRANAFAQSALYKEAISDYVNARKYVDDAKQLPTLAYQAVLAHQNTFAEEVIRFCNEKKIDCSLAKGLLAMLNFEYKKAYDLFTEAEKQEETELFKYKTYIHYSLGNVSKAYNCSRNYFGQDNYFYFLQMCLRIVTCNDLPSYYDEKSFYAKCANFLIWGIFHSLPMPIVDVPLDLYMPRCLLNGIAPEVTAPQMAMLEEDKAAAEQSQDKEEDKKEEKDTKETQKPKSLAESNPSEQDVDKMMKIAQQMKITSSYNTREHICTGLALIQIVQMLNQKQMPSLDTCVASICHWLRLVDATVLFFDRVNEKLKIFLHRGSFDTILKCYSQSVFNYLKSRLVYHLSPGIPLRLAGKTDIQAAIEQATNPDDLGAIFKTGLTIPISQQVSFFYYREQEGYSFGIEVNPPTTDQKEKLNITWCSLSNMLKSKNVSKIETAAFIEKATEFLFTWMYISPITALNDVVGYILFRSVLWAYFGKDVIKSTPEPIIMQIDSYFSNFSPLYQMYILPHIQLTKEGQSIDGLPQVIEVFPTYLHRIRALLNIRSVDIPEKCDPREYIKPIYCSVVLSDKFDLSTSDKDENESEEKEEKEEETDETN